MIDYDKFNNLIDSFNDYIITTHINPDGDAIGSSIALYHFLKSLKKKVKIVNYSNTPKYYQFLDPNNEIFKYEDNYFKDILETEVIFLLDLNELSRVKSMGEAVAKSKAVKVIIDHHLPNTPFANLEFTDISASSTGEILYRLLSEDGKISLSTEVSSALFTAIMTDTISFHLPTATSNVYRIAANLIDWGANPSRIYFNVYEQNDISRFKLLGEVLSSIQIIYKGKLLYMQVNQDIFEKTNTQEQDIDNFIDYGMMIKGISAVIFFVELKDGIKMSFRSRGDIPINLLAKKFGGNGHKNAAGARIFNKTLKEMIPIVLKSAEEFIK